jgi:hypothetical protein
MLLRQPLHVIYCRAKITLFMFHGNHVWQLRKMYVATFKHNKNLPDDETIVLELVEG